MMAKAWFTYTGPNTPSAYYVTTNYYLVTPTFAPGYTGNGSQISLIYANKSLSGMNPTSISLNMQWYIIFGLATNYAQPINPIGTKKYLYLK